MRGLGLIIAAFVALPAFAQWNDTTEEVDIEQLFDSLYASKDVISDNKTIAVEKNDENTAANNIGDSNNVEPIRISKADSVRIAKEAHAEALYNPMFLDWVYLSSYDLEEECDDEAVLNNIRMQAKRYVAENAPELYSYHRDDLPDVKGLQLEKRQHSDVLSDFLLKQELKQLPQNALSIKHEDKLWDLQGRCSAQISQSYISRNWYTGGYSNVAILGHVLFKANYDNKKNINFENIVEWKAGFNSSMGDTLRFLNTNEDIFRISSNLGVKAVKNWFYSLSAEFNTQLFNTYVENSNELSTAPFSPIRFYLSLGMEYKYKKMLKINISPFSYKLTYVMNKTRPEGGGQSVAERFNIPEGKSTLNAFGSRFQVDFAYAFTKELRMETKMYVYTDYKNVEFDWEVTGNFIATRFLTIQLSLHPRYDSSLVLAEGEKTRFQFREFVSLGFLYAF